MLFWLSYAFSFFYILFLHAKLSSALVVNRQAVDTDLDQFSRQPTTTPNGKECTYSCPPTNGQGRTLVKSPFAVSYRGELSYSIFDCVYGIPQSNIEPQTCTYYKDTGLPALMATYRLVACPHEAIPCSSLAVNGVPEFSAMERDKIEQKPWVKTGAPLLWTKEVWDVALGRDRD